MKSVIMEHPKTSHKLSQNVRKDERLPKQALEKNCNIPLYKETKKKKNFLDDQKYKKKETIRCLASHKNKPRSNQDKSCKLISNQ